MPLYCILQNATLAELARCRPTTREELLAVKGMGPVKAERYGHTLLEIVRERLTGDGETGRQGDEETGRQGDIGLSAVCPSPPLPVSPSLPSSHWTRRLLAAGFTRGRVHGDSRPDARGRLGARPAEPSRIRPIKNCRRRLPSPIPRLDSREPTAPGEFTGLWPPSGSRWLPAVIANRPFIRYNCAVE